MANVVLLGAQWGDEGKGKIVDYLMEGMDAVVRYQGGNNAGHTVEIGDERYVLHLVPSGILRPGKVCVIGNGVVINPLTLCEELDGIAKRGIDIQDRFFISDRAHMVFPYHIALDSGLEAAGRPGEKIGTTKRGIGPAYADKASRRNLRMGDLNRTDFAQVFADRTAEKNLLLAAIGAPPVQADEAIAELARAAETLRPFITDTVSLLHGMLRDGKSLLFEGAQGAMLDIDFGTYPFVTSSNTTAGGACTGSGVPPRHIDRTLGIIKAYTTRVGEGAFPTELKDDIGKHLAARGNEFGSTTGRPRRCGWFDAVVARYSAMINGFDGLAVTKLDVLDELETLKIAVAYELNGRRINALPGTIADLSACRPIYEEWPGWQTSTEGATTFSDLPENARRYLARLAELTGAPIEIMSVGPRRASTFLVSA